MKKSEKSRREWECAPNSSLRHQSQSGKEGQVMTESGSAVCFESSGTWKKLISKVALPQCFFGGHLEYYLMGQHDLLRSLVFLEGCWVCVTWVRPAVLPYAPGGCISETQLSQRQWWACKRVCDSEELSQTCPVCRRTKQNPRGSDVTRAGGANWPGTSLWLVRLRPNHRQWQRLTEQTEVSQKETLLPQRPVRTWCRATQEHKSRTKTSSLLP